MTVKTYCDVCGKEAPIQRVTLYGCWEGSTTVASYECDVCVTCRNRVEKAADHAAEREVERIRREVMRDEGR